MSVVRYDSSLHIYVFHRKMKTEFIYLVRKLQYDKTLRAVYRFVDISIVFSFFFSIRCKSSNSRSVKHREDSSAASITASFMLLWRLIFMPDLGRFSSLLLQVQSLCFVRSLVKLLSARISRWCHALQVSTYVSLCVDGKP